MKFKKLKIEYKGNTKIFSFSHNNIIFSENNSVGKSTVLRLLLWSIGYKIPGTYNMQFNKIRTEVEFITNNILYSAYREENNINLYCEGKNIISYDITGDDDIWFSYIWKNVSKYAINNILGAIYMDQDRGWTLLNRGKVIGNIRFNARDLLIGLQGNENYANELLNKLSKVKYTLNQVNNLLKISELSDSGVRKESYYNIDFDKEYRSSKINLNIVENKIKQIKSQLKSENSSKEYIISSNIMIKHNDEIIPVTDDNILNVNDNINYLKIMLLRMENKKKKIMQKLIDIQEKFKDETSSLFKEEDVVDNTIKAISNIPINVANLEAKSNELQKSRDELNDDIENEFLDSNNIISETEDWIMVFAKKLGVDDVLKGKRYIFTRDIKSISGTIYYKVVFCFKMAYIKSIEKHLEIKLPIILDSPSGREVTDRNIKSVIEILNEYFYDNQIIIASIHLYDLKDLNKMEIKNSIFEEDI